MERLEATVRGRVQMVMFRDFVRRKASALRLDGTVKNCADGSVRVVAEGPREALDALAAHLRRGPLLARVESVEEKRGAARGGIDGFHIVYE